MNLCFFFTVIKSILSKNVANNTILAPVKSSAAAPTRRPKPHVDCTLRQHTCGNGKCVPLAWTCDGEDDCGDNTDESTELCKNGKCLPTLFINTELQGVCQ